MNDETAYRSLSSDFRDFYHDLRLLWFWSDDEISGADAVDFMNENLDLLKSVDEFFSKVECQR